eukprot:TRINITY_DN6233_c0_g1_i2.p1 TRINITY_DN6233_c0_g1~~TRINITY_DN6233_c0_g1_i2.p1  ORF type:complete len:357 (+),score=46.53 TRINITY_DN6233_c0_g1_i2:125-1195(+)
MGKDALKQVLKFESTRHLFATLVEQAKGIVVCRAGPSQKADLTRFLQESKLLVCCVGDGANDVEMIEAADVGVGIKAGENAHAAASSDIAVKLVTELPSLMFDYGKTNWERNAQLTIFISSMKLMVIVSLLFYDVWNDFQANALFTGKMLLMFNFFYGWGVIVYSFMHAPIPLEQSQGNPGLYRRRNGVEIVSPTRNVIWWTRTGLDALLTLGLSMWWFGDNDKRINVLGDIVSDAQFANFVLVMVWINLKVSAETGVLMWKTARFVHASVLMTIMVFVAVAVLPVWHSVPAGFVRFEAFAILFIFSINHALDWLVMIFWDGQSNPIRGVDTFLLAKFFPFLKFVPPNSTKTKKQD